MPSVYVREVTPPDCALIKEELDKAKEVYLKLISGGNIRSVYDSDGSRIEYSQPNVEHYRDLVAGLQAKYDACIAGSPTALTRPLTFIFP